jgi:L-iditol 2-dehydrogenase
MLAAHKTGPERAVLIEVPLPQLGPDDVLVQVRACAICASDLPGWTSTDLGDGLPGQWDPNNPGLTGHEIAGDIVAVGQPALEGRVGERVWIDAIAGCGTCDECRVGRQTFCSNVAVICQGFAEYVAAPARQCHPIPSQFDYTIASLICDMVGTPMGAAKRAAIRSGESVAVWGLGPVGLGLVQAARIAGGSPIVGLDVVSNRRRLAEKLGATLTIDPLTPRAIDCLREATGKGLDVALCAVGSLDAARQAFEALPLDGRMVTVAGFPPAGGQVAKWVTGSWGCFEKDWPEVLDHLTTGRFELKDYITHTFPLHEIEEAFTVRLHDLETSLKVVVTPNRGA